MAMVVAKPILFFQLKNGSLKVTKSDTLSMLETASKAVNIKWKIELEEKLTAQQAKLEKRCKELRAEIEVRVDKNEEDIRENTCDIQILYDRQNETRKELQCHIINSEAIADATQKQLTSLNKSFGQCGPSACVTTIDDSAVKRDVYKKRKNIAEHQEGLQTVKQERLATKRSVISLEDPDTYETRKLGSITMLQFI